MTHLADAGEEREALAAWRTFVGAAGRELLQQLGIDHPWIILRMPYPGEEDGEIDAVAGRVVANEAVMATLQNEELSRQFTHDESSFGPCYGALRLDSSYLVGIEIKCAFLEWGTASAGIRRPCLRSGKAGPSKHRRLNGKLRGLLRIGFDKALLLDLVAGLRCETANMGDAIPYAGLSATAVDLDHRRLKNFQDVVPEDVGYFAITLGAALGAPGHVAGYRLPLLVREAPTNPHRAEPDGIQRRERLNAHIEKLLTSRELLLPPLPPYVFDFCPNCRRLGQYHETCPEER